MGRYMRKCKGVVDEIAVVGARTSRASEALAMVDSSASSDAPSSSANKIRKAPTTPFDVRELRTRRRVVMENSATSSVGVRPGISSWSDVVVVCTADDCSSGEITSASSSPCSSSNDAGSSCGKVLKDHHFESVADPEVESALTTSSKYLDSQSAARRRENNFRALKSDDLDSPPRYPDAKSTVQIKMPSDSEIEDFFAAAEKDLHKRFSEKYNFDLVKEVPLEGRYEWVQVPIKP